ncbi:MAG: hypothetical protein AAGA41_08585 [Pseudomonadota bacterium]
MTRTRRTSLIMIAGVSALLSVPTSCDTSWQFGKISPTLRFQLQFEEPKNQAQVIKSLDHALATEGVIVSDEIDFGTASRARARFTMSQEQNDLVESISITFPRYPKNATEHREFHIQFVFRSKEDLGVSGWRLFSRWHNEHLPRVFPKANIVVKRHPAHFTQPENLEAYAEASNVELTEQAIAWSIQFNGPPEE